MKTLGITNRKGETFEIILDDDDFVRLSHLSWHVRRGGYVGRGVRVGSRSENRVKQIMLHREIMQCPSDMVVDHINGNPLDNRKSNLRICMAAQNALNRRRKNKNNTSGFPGVRWNEKISKWVARARNGTSKRHLGVFDTAESAYEAYCDYIKTNRGEFAHVL